MTSNAVDKFNKPRVLVTGQPVPLRARSLGPAQLCSLIGFSPERGTGVPYKGLQAGKERGVSVYVFVGLL